MEAALMRTYAKPWEINIGFNAEEDERARAFTALNERPYCHWRYPLIEAGIDRAETKRICEKAGFSILLAMYKKMGRFDCFWCGNQTPAQALRVIEHYPELAAEWAAAEAKKGHSFMSLPLASLEADDAKERPLFQCSCFGGNESVWDEDEADIRHKEAT